jgi:hypothetical protein
MELTPCNLSGCLEDVKRARAKHPSIFPDGVNNAQVTPKHLAMLWNGRQTALTHQGHIHISCSRAWTSSPRCLSCNDTGVGEWGRSAGVARGVAECGDCVGLLWQAARVLAALNTNSHELEELGGSGLFRLACLFEHSCRPNCAFSTYK